MASLWPNDQPGARGSGDAAPDPASAADATPLRRKSFVPLYFQLAEVLKERIESGQWDPGGRFLSERELTEEFGLSRTVIRPALAMLERDGQLVRIKGKGTFLAPRKVVDRPRGLVRTLGSRVPQGTSIEVLAAARQRPEPHVAQLLGLPTVRDQVAHVTSLTSVDGRPLFLCDSFINVAAFPEILDVVREHGTIGPSPHPVADLRLFRTDMRLQASFCSAFEAERLDLPAGGPVLLLRCVEHARRRAEPGPSMAMEVARVVYRADTIELEAELS